MMRFLIAALVLLFALPIYARGGGGNHRSTSRSYMTQERHGWVNRPTSSIGAPRPHDHWVLHSIAPMPNVSGLDQSLEKATYAMSATLHSPSRCCVSVIVFFRVLTENARAIVGGVGPGMSVGRPGTLKHALISSRSRLNSTSQSAFLNE